MSQAAAIDFIREALNEGVIEEDQAAALWAADVQDLPIREVAARIGIGEGAAKVRLHRARKRLKLWLHESRRGRDSSENL
ncbi:MAG: RNA polymerase sigma factor [Actinomycetota bacterium]